MDSAAVLSTLESIRDGRFAGVDSLVIVRHGRLAAEGYFNGYGPETLHDLRSTGKSFTSALAGIAIGQGLFTLDDPVSLLIPQFESHANMDARKRAITIRHLLDMRSGLECNDWNSASRGNEERMYDTRDWVGFILDLPMANDPGAVASYCTGGVIVLGQVISWRSGMALDAYAAAYLFAPLGIQQSSWRRSPDGNATGGGGLKLRPRDAAKFGLLYLNGGVWNGARVVPADWVTKSRERVTTLGNDGYGSLWWKRSFAHGGAHGGVLLHVGQRRKLHLRFSRTRPGRGVHGLKLQLAARRPAVCRSWRTSCCPRFARSTDYGQPSHGAGSTRNLAVMSQAVQRILVLGAYGFFGYRICAALAKNPRIQLILAGRDLAKATAAAYQLGLQRQFMRAPSMPPTRSSRSTCASSGSPR